MRNEIRSTSKFLPMCMLLHVLSVYADSVPLWTSTKVFSMLVLLISSSSKSINPMGSISLRLAVVAPCLYS